jgi:hypothetical protein
MAIGYTSDERLDKALTERPELVMEWLETYSKGKVSFNFLRSNKVPLRWPKNKVQFLR